LFIFGKVYNPILEYKSKILWMIEISRMVNDKAKKIWLAENSWIPAINTYQENTNTANGILLN
jgi:hypothetical protein